MSILILMTGFAIALVLSISITPLVLRLATAYDLYDEPDISSKTAVSRRVHSKPIPRLGGIAIVLAFFATYMAFKQDLRIPYILLLSLLVFALGAFDDVRPISAKVRFVLQIAVSSLTVYFGNLAIEKLYLGFDFFLQFPFWIGFLISTFIVVGAINALNMIDGLDGLAGGISVISLALLSLLYYLSFDDTSLMAYLSIPTIGAILGFLRYNSHPASIFMGDNGSNWLGFMIGLHILLVLKSQTVVWGGTTKFWPGGFTRCPTALRPSLLCSPDL